MSTRKRAAVIPVVGVLAVAIFGMSASFSHLEGAMTCFGSIQATELQAKIMSTQQTNDDESIVGKSITYARPTAMKSLHPKYKLWNEMTAQEQQDMLNTTIRTKILELVQIFETFDRDKNPCGDKLRGDPKLHPLCGDPPTDHPCHFISFGISKNFRFDHTVANEWNCRGFAADPTVVHPSNLQHENITFHNVAHTMISSNEQTLQSSNPWWYVSISQILSFLKLDFVDILKMDCEGCELAFARDILAEDPNLLSHFGQVSIEVHLSKEWIKDDEHLYYFGLLFRLLEEADFVLTTTFVESCSGRHERIGCVPQFAEWGFPACRGNSCRDFLFVHKDFLAQVK